MLIFYGVLLYSKAVFELIFDCEIGSDAGGGRNLGPARDNGINQAAEKGDAASLPALQEESKKTSLSAR